MKIRIHPDAAKRYADRRNSVIGPQGIWTEHEKRYFEFLTEAAGELLEVETEYLFSDQFNTGPWRSNGKGHSDCGWRVMHHEVVEVVDDVRPSKVRCNWCGKISEAIVERCSHCTKDNHLERFEVPYADGVILKPRRRRGA